MNNYIEHNIRVKTREGLLNHSQDWEWYVRHIESNFDLNDIASWDEFMMKSRTLLEILESFVKIVEVSKVPIKSKSSVLSDLIGIANYWMGRLEKSACADMITTNYGYLLLLVVCVTKLENSVTGKKSIADFSLFTYKNYWRIVDIGPKVLFDEDINKISRLNLIGWNEVEKVFRDNMNNISYDFSDDFFGRFKNRLYNVNAFNCQNIILDQCCTWEEQFLLDMLKTYIDGEKIESAFVINGIEYPDKAQWTKEVLDHMQSFFHSNIADFIIESIRYFIYNERPAKEVILDHFKLVNESICNNSVKETLRSSSLKIVGCLFKNHVIDECVKKETTFINAIKSIQRIQDIDSVKKIKDLGIPISKEQSRLLKKATADYFNDVKNNNDLSEFLQFLQNRPDIQHLTNDQLEFLNDRFVDLLEAEERGVIIASAFYEYMSFLIEANSKCVGIDKSKLHILMNNTQLMWELDYYEQQISGMNVFNIDLPATKEEKGQFNELAANSPITVANSVAIAKSEELCNVMKEMSDSPLIHCISHYRIEPAFPVKVDKIDYSRHDIDKLLCEHVQWIKKEKGYKFLNNLDEDNYVRGILEQFRMRVDAIIALITEELSLYNKVDSCCDAKLIEYNEELKMAHLTQLFPILEIKLRDLARNEGYFPFKKEKVRFMQYNDPSSILREIIIDSCKSIHGFDPVSDLYFIYNCMYNTNSINIRNEVIHGRGHFSQGRLHYALRITLICILVVEQRLQIIYNNRRQELKTKSTL